MQGAFQKLARDTCVSKSRYKKIVEVNSIYPHIFSSHIELKYVDEATKTIRINRFTQDISELNATFKIHGTLFSMQQVKPEILSAQSILHQALVSLLARYLLRKDHLSYKVY